MTEGGGICENSVARLIHWDGREWEASGAEARCLSSPNRRHKCLLHPVVLGSKSYPQLRSPWQQISRSTAAELYMNICEIAIDIY
jgi:hypothetical protein